MMKKVIFIILMFASVVGFSQSLPNIWVPTSGTNTYATNIVNFGGSYSNKIAAVSFTNGNTSSATLAINSMAPIALRLWDGDSWEPLVSGDIPANTKCFVVYNGSFFEVTKMLNDGAGSGGGGSGDVVGPASSTDNAVARYDGTTGKLIQNSSFVVSDAGAVTTGSWAATAIPYTAGGTGLTILGTAFQMQRVNAGATGLEWFTPGFNPMTTTGDMIYSSDNSGTPARMAAAASGNSLLSGTTPSWGKIGLTTHISGILPMANGGTAVALTDPGANNLMLWDDTDGTIGFITIGANLSYDHGTHTISASGGGARLDQLTAATGTNTINSTSFGQEWQWNSLAGFSALKLSTTSTAAASDLQRILDVSLSGANATSTQTTVGGYFSNTHTGTGSTNIALYAESSGGATNNYAFKSGGGVMFVGNAAADLVPSNTRLAVRGTGTGTENIISLMNSGGTARFTVTNQGALTLTNAVQNSVAFNNTFTADATNRHSVTIGGTFTMATTSGSGHAGHLLRINAGHTTGNTNQELNAVTADGTITVNSTGVIYRGVYVNPTFAGAQTPTKKAFQATSGDIYVDAGGIVAGATTITASTRADFVGTGTTTGNTLRLADSGNSANFLFLDNGDFQVDKTITAGGTTGNQTINKLAGTVNFAASATTLTVTNSLVTANSMVFCEVRTNDATATIKNVVPASGSFVITLTAAATAETSVGFFIVN